LETARAKERVAQIKKTNACNVGRLRGKYMLSYEEQSKIIEDVKKRHEEETIRRVESRLEECKKNGIIPPDPKTYPKQYCDHPNTMENGTATFFYIIIMFVGAIFKSRWAIWIIATVIWARFITRHNR
jgi:hypothetical protein